MAQSSSTQRTATACVAAWLLPGAGYLVLGRRRRGVLALLAIAALFALGVRLGGRLYTPTAGELLSLPASAACLGVGPSYFLARRSPAINHGRGWVREVGYEAGSVAFVAAGLLNILLLLDTFDIAVGRRS